MKRYLYSILLAALTIVPMNLSSCSDDDDDAKTENQSNNSADNQSDTGAIDKSDYLKYTITSENEVSVSGVNGNVPVYVVIPEQVTIDGKTYAVTGIANSAFKDCSGMLTVTIPNSVTAIGDSAFYNCGSLINVSIPDSVTSIADYTFAECKSLMKVTIPVGVVKIGERVFENCSPLINVSIPSSVDSIFESGMVCGYPYVDLGLPSGLKWASYNVGATSFLQYGDYADWTEKDSVVSKWCASWRLPSDTAFKELIDGCYWQKVNDFLGVSGQLGISKTNGKHIFFPDAGYMKNDSTLVDKNVNGYYWSTDMATYYYPGSYHYWDNELTEYIYHYFQLKSSDDLPSVTAFNTDCIRCSVRPVSD